MNEDGEALATWLEARMRARRLSRRQLATMAGVDASTISRIVRQRRSARWMTVLRLADALGEPPPGLAATYPQWDALTRVERALRADPELEPGDSDEMMRFYRAVRDGLTRGDSSGG